jgi:hypothetical protein
MSYPVHPDTIIVKNEFYPLGLKEIDIWNYYQLVKSYLLQQVKFRDLIFFIMVDVNKPIVYRKGKGERFIRLNLNNYDTLITGRTISIHSSMSNVESFGIVDIDTDDFKLAKEAASDTYFFLKENAKFIEDVSIRFTGKTSFHLFCQYKRKLKVDYAKLMLKDILEKSDLTKKYTVEYKRKAGIPNLDLGSNKLFGGYITLWSLSILGLRCMEIPVEKLKTFKKENALIKVL